MKYLLPVVLLLTLSACGSTAKKTATATTNNQEVATAEAEKPKKDMICRSEKTLGSNMKTKVCRPKS